MTDVLQQRVRLNKEECADIARRVAEHISVLKRVDEDEDLSDDLRERLERYHRYVLLLAQSHSRKSMR